MPPVNFDISDILLAEYRIASITAYNRLESTPRMVNFDRSLKAEIRDALWMLTRQWQFGEFQGEDAATAIGTKILGEHTVMDKVQFPGNNIFSYDDILPLETAVERERVKPNLFLAVQMGRYFIKLIKNNPNFNDRFGFLLDKYQLNYIPDKNDYEGHQLLNAVKGKIIDGYTLHNDIISGNLSVEDASSFTDEIESFRDWFKRNYSQPADNINSPWLPSQLEYQFAVSSGQQGSQKKLSADHYHEGHLDWYSFDVSAPGRLTEEPSPETGSPVKEHISSYIPSPVSFKGMPNPRFWTMEENQTDFGKIDTSPTGLLHLLFAEFGLICSNDWCILPYQLSINTLCEIKAIVVTDVFGQHILIRPAGRGAESQWQRWTMFHHTDTSNATTDTNLFYLVPAITKLLEGAPLEQVNFLRDEMANLVWAVEKTVLSQAGKGVSGDEMALKEEPPVPVSLPAIDNAPVIRYVLGTTVPDNWIPFIPVHMEGNNTEIRLQRAAMPGGKGALGTILKEKTAPYYIDEEIIPRSGVQVNISAQRTRWLNGKTYLWLGRRKEAGKGEGLSELKFDQIVDVKKL